MYTPSLEEVRILQPTTDPFALPVQSVRNLLAYEPSNDLDHRVRTEGVVTSPWSSGGVEGFFISDGIQGAAVVSKQLTPLKLGDKVDLADFLDLGDYTPTIHDAVYRKVGSGPPPLSRPVTSEELLSGNLDGDLVSINGRLIKQSGLRTSTLSCWTLKDLFSVPSPRRESRTDA